MAQPIPQENTLDSTLQLMREGFPFIHNRVQKFQSDIFETRFLGMKVVCLHGPEAAKVFYDPDKFMRQGAIPKRIQKTLLGENGIQTVDGEAHRHRKMLFMSFMTPGSLHQLMQLTSENWQKALSKWAQMEEVSLFEEVQNILCQAACSWVGVPLPEAEVTDRARDFAAMVDAFGAVGPRHWRGKRARRRTEDWIMNMVEAVRLQELTPAPESPLYQIAWFKELDGQLLEPHMAAVEVINLIRPIVAIAWYHVFSAVALHQNPALQERLVQAEPGFDEVFIQEVRRFYPFGPFVGALVKTEFEWQGYLFTPGTMVFLDIYGTNHDARTWPDPDTFNPDRFRNWQESPFDFIPQGGGHYENGHRCAGEWITIELGKVGLRFLTQGMQYHVPEQDLEIPLDRMPTIPNSHFIINQVKPTGQLNQTPKIGKCPFGYA